MRMAQAVSSNTVPLRRRVPKETLQAIWIVSCQLSAIARLSLRSVCFGVPGRSRGPRIRRHGTFLLRLSYYDKDEVLVARRSVTAGDAVRRIGRGNGLGCMPSKKASRGCDGGRCVSRMLGRGDAEEGRRRLPIPSWRRRRSFR
jgi:hypothetical protein